MVDSKFQSAKNILRRKVIGNVLDAAIGQDWKHVLVCSIVQPICMIHRLKDDDVGVHVTDEEIIKKKNYMFHMFNTFTHFYNMKLIINFGKIMIYSTVKDG